MLNQLLELNSPANAAQDMRVTICDNRLFIYTVKDEITIEGSQVTHWNALTHKKGLDLPVSMIDTC